MGHIYDQFRQKLISFTYLHVPMIILSFRGGVLDGTTVDFGLYETCSKTPGESLPKTIFKVKITYDKIFAHCKSHATKLACCTIQTFSKDNEYR